MGAEANPAFELRVEEDLVVKDEKFLKGSVLRLENFRGSQFWDMTAGGSKSLELKEYEMQKEILHSGKVKLVDKSQGKDILSAIDWKKFSMKPNRNINGAFKKVFKTDREHKKYMARIEDTLKFHYGLEHSVDLSGITLKDVPLEHQALFVSWSRTSRWEDEANWGKDLGAFKDCYSVILSDEMLGAIGTTLTGHTYHLEVVELDDRYRFILNYNEIIGNRWLFENFKGEPWNL